jgi:hypothetical protein
MKNKLVQKSDNVSGGSGARAAQHIRRLGAAGKPTRLTPSTLRAGSKGRGRGGIRNKRKYIAAKKENEDDDADSEDVSDEDEAMAKEDTRA